MQNGSPIVREKTFRKKNQKRKKNANNNYWDGYEKPSSQHSDQKTFAHSPNAIVSHSAAMMQLQLLLTIVWHKPKTFFR